MVEISATKKIQVNAKTLSLYCKICDAFTASLLDAEGVVLKEYDGYVPDIMPGDADGGSHYGDYLILDIDIDTGMITNWKKPSAKQIEEFIAGGEE